MSNLKQQLKDLEIEIKMQEKVLSADGLLDDMDKAVLQQYRNKINQLKSKIDQEDGVPSKAHAKALELVDKLKKLAKTIANKHFILKKAAAKLKEKTSLTDADKKVATDLKTLTDRFEKQLGWLSKGNRKQLSKEQSTVKQAQTFWTTVQEQQAELEKQLQTDTGKMPTTKDEILNYIKNANISIPLDQKFDHSFDNGVSVSIVFAPVLHLRPDLNVTGKISANIKGLEKALGYKPEMETSFTVDFTGKSASMELGVDPVKFSVSCSGDKSTFFVEVDVVKCIAGKALDFLKRITRNVLTVTASGKIGVGATWDGSKFLTKYTGGYEIGAELNFLAIKNREMNNQILDANGDGIVDENELHNKNNDPEIQKLHDRVNENVEGGVVVGASAKIDVSTEEGAENGLTLTTAAGEAKVYAQIGKFKIELSVQDEGKAIGSPEERRQLEEAALKSALQDALRGAKTSYTSFHERKAAAKKVDGLFAAAHAKYRAQAEKKLVPKDDPNAVNTTLPGLYKPITQIFDYYAYGLGIYQSNTIYSCLRKAGVLAQVEAIINRGPSEPVAIHGTVVVEYNYDKDSKQFKFDGGSINGLAKEFRQILKLEQANALVIGLPLQIRLKIDTTIFGDMIIASRQSKVSGNTQFKLVSVGEESNAEAAAIVQAFNKQNPMKNLKIHSVL